MQSSVSGAKPGGHSWHLLFLRYIWSLRTSSSPEVSKNLFLILNLQHFFLIYFFSELNVEKGREREKHQLAVPLIYAFIGWFLYVPWPATLGELDNAPSNQAIQPGLLRIFIHKWYQREQSLAPRSTLNPRTF